MSHDIKMGYFKDFSSMVQNEMLKANVDKSNHKGSMHSAVIIENDS